MKLIKFEFLKFMTNKLFIISFLVLFVLNFLLLNYQNYSDFKTGISYSAYKKLNIDLKHMTHQEKGEYINRLYERVKAINTIYDIQNLSKNEEMREYADALRKENLHLYNKYYQEATSNPVFKFTNDSSNELKFLTYVKEDYDKVNEYESLVNEIIEKADYLQNVSIFNNKESTSLSNIIATSNAYKKMIGIEPDYQLSIGMNKLTRVGVTDFFVVLLIFILSTILIIEEKEKNLFVIIRSTKNGHMKTILSKIISLFIGVLFISFLFYGMNFLYYFISFGYGDLFTPIQSMSSFMFSTLKMNGLEYLLLFFTSKTFVFFFFAMIMFFLAMNSNNGTQQILMLTILSLISFGLYRGVSIHSNINVLKYANFIGVLDINAMYSIFENLQFFHLMVFKASFLIIFKYSLIIILILATIFKYLGNMNVQIKEGRVFQFIKSIKIFHKIRLNSVLGFEFYKLLITNKAIIIILLFTFFMGYDLKQQNFNLSFNENFYKNYMEILSGDLTKEKETMIKESDREYKNAQKQLDNINILVRDGKISKTEGELSSIPYQDIMRSYPIFQKVYANYEYVKNNSQASFVYDTGYNKLFRLNNQIHEGDIYLIVVTLIILLNLFIMEYRTGFISILNTTKNGREKTAKSKILVSIIVCTIVYIISIVPEILQVAKTYGLDGLNLKVASLQTLVHFSWDITISEYMIVFYFVRYISYIMIILIIHFLSLKFRNMLFVFITSLSIFLFPFLFHIFKIDILNKMRVYPFMNLSLMINDGSEIIFIWAIVILILFLYNNVVKRLD